MNSSYIKRMDLRTIILIIPLILLILSGMAEGVDITSCTCECYGKNFNASGSSLQNCQMACGGACGVLTKLYDDCPNKCASEYCIAGEVEAVTHGDSVDTRHGCNDTCIARCDLNSVIAPEGHIVPLIRYAILFLAAVILAYCGLKYLLAEDPESRAEARKCLIYVFSALILAGIAHLIVELIYTGELFPVIGGPSVPKPPPGPGKPEIASFRITDLGGADITEIALGEWFKVTSEVIDHSGSGINRVESVFEYPDGRPLVHVSLADIGGNIYERQVRFVAPGDPTGDYSISINATDNRGGITTSGPKSLTVN